MLNENKGADFAGKTALITGAAVGIGRATAVLFAKRGANVILLDINEEKLERTEQEIHQYTDKVFSVKCDVGNEGDVNAAIQTAEEKFGSIDILVNNAALWRDRGLFHEVDCEIWKTYLNINVMGTVYCIRAVLPKMLERHYGRIINVASVAGVYGNANMAHYSTTKGAVISMTKALAKEVADKGVLVNCVSPGSVSPAENDDMNYYRESPLSFMGRTGTDMENANLICFLASDMASYISGENIIIDGCRKKM